jgi:two-component system CheB/CheR fusion protein
VTNSPDNSRPLDSLRLVAIGASAGGLEPLQSFFGAIKDAPKNTAFVVIQHLSPDYKSMMGELLARTTSIPIATVEDGTQLEAGHIYLIPPASTYSSRQGHLRCRSQALGGGQPSDRRVRGVCRRFL